MVLGKLAEIGEGRKRKHFEHAAHLVNTFEPEVEELPDGELAGKTEELKRRLKDGESLEDVLPEAFAVVREA
ncbi:MAG: hypothetical protein ACRDH1_09755, partial [Actinomycetota bacterium]